MQLSAEHARLLKRLVISRQQQVIAQLGFKAVLHFELEGCVEFAANADRKLNLARINQQLRQLGIAGELVNEYWRGQWEYVSLFHGQSPLQEADNLYQVMYLLPKWFKQQGVSKTLIKPVVWHGDNGQMMATSRTVMSAVGRSVHIPNAVQINLSANNQAGDNIIPEKQFGEYLQARLLATSYACSLLFLPEQEAFERLALKTRYGLQAELCSPNDLSGGHQGSIALYKQWGKHNQALGQQTLVLDHCAKPLIVNNNWQQTARVEHRLGASSERYCPYWNVMFALANLIDSLQAYVHDQCHQYLSMHMAQSQLPSSLDDSEKGLGAKTLFAQETWLTNHINGLWQQSDVLTQLDEPRVTLEQQLLVKLLETKSLGNTLKQQLIHSYQQELIT